MNGTRYYIILNIDIFPIINQEKFKIRFTKYISALVCGWYYMESMTHDNFWSLFHRLIFKRVTA